MGASPHADSDINCGDVSASVEQTSNGNERARSAQLGSPTGQVDALNVFLDGKAAHLVLDSELLYVFQGGMSTKELIWTDGLLNKVSVVVPHILVLNASFVDDTDGATLLIRLLTPPPDTTKAKSWLRRRVLAQVGAKRKGAKENEKRSERNVLYTGDDNLRSLLDGPFAKLRLATIEARVAPEHAEAAAKFAKKAFSLAYKSPVTGQPIKPYRHFRVLVNPHGGPGRAKREWERKVRPILDAAGCQMSVTITTHRNHGLEIVHSEADLAERFDAILSVSGDGMMHETLNGIAARPDAHNVLDKLAVVPIPTGSGNACSVSLLGPTQGFNLAQAALNAVKGHWLGMEICTVTQPADSISKSPHLSAMLDVLRKPIAKDQPSTTQLDEKKGFVRYYSFLSQTIGLMADLDIGTEHLRALGDARFVVGYLQGVLADHEAPVHLDVKLGSKGTFNRQEMRRRVKDRLVNDYAAAEVQEENKLEALRADNQPIPVDTSSDQLALRAGSVVDDVGGDALPTLDLVDPSWPLSRSLLGGVDLKPAGPGAAPGWARVRQPLTSIYAGKLPYVARDLLQFPYAIPGDGLVDVVLMLHDGGRAAKLRVLNGADVGEVVYDKAVSYLKVEAFRVTPKVSAGSSKLKKGGIISIDGERVPYAPFQVEVAPHIQLRTLSLYGNFYMKHVFPSS